MTPLRFRIFFVLSSLPCMTSGWATGSDSDSVTPPSLREAVGAALFEDAGLDQLSPEQQSALVDGLAAIFEKGENPFLSPEAVKQRFGFPSLFQKKVQAAEAAEPKEVTARLVGDFSGWSGRTRFELENGQVWVQIENDFFDTRKLTSPVITIEKGLLGVYYLSVEGYGSRVKVRRIK